MADIQQRMRCADDELGEGVASEIYYGSLLPR